MTAQQIAVVLLLGLPSLPSLSLHRSFSTCAPRCAVRLFPKGDGKKRRPKALPPAAPGPPPSPPATPGRVSGDSLLSARKQIALVRAYRARQRTGVRPPKERTSFRRKSNGADAAAEAASSELGELPRGKYNTTAVPLLLVDGYNVIGYWARLKKRRDRDDMEGARRRC